MNTTLRYVGAIIGGLAIGGIVNSAIITLSMTVIPPPAGSDLTTPEGLQASMHLMEPRHFLMPFLAHAIGTFVGAFLAAKMAATYKMRFALAIGFVFLLGGIAMIFMVPSPLWFTITDLLLAYIPMAYLAGKLATPKTLTTDFS